MATTSPTKRLSSGVGIRSARRSASSIARSSSFGDPAAARSPRRRSPAGAGGSALRAAPSRPPDRNVRPRSRPAGRPRVPLVRARPASRSRSSSPARRPAGPRRSRPRRASQTSDRDVGALGGALGAQLGVVVDRAGDLRPPADARPCRSARTGAPVDLEPGVDRVAGRPGQLRDDHPLGAEEGVDQRRLADVRAADDRDRDTAPRPRLAARPRPRGRARRGGRAGRRCRGRGWPRPGSARRGRARTARRPSGSSRRSRPCWRRRPPGRSARRRISATSASPWRSPARASRTSATASASAIASRACAWTARESESLASRSTPPVSISSNRIPFHSHSSALRSRVTPASLWTTASRPPTRRLTSVDLPTLGKPTTAIRGSRAVIDGPARARGRARRSAATTSSIAEPGRVELDRVVGGAQRAVLALAVAAVALGLRREHLARTARRSARRGGARAPRRWR